MIDTRAVGQELQEQLVGAARRGQQQAKKAQEQARKAQEQVRKGQEAVAEAVKSLTATAETIRPQLPAIKLPPVRLPSAETVRAGAGTMRASAQEIAEQLLASQRKLADQVAQAAVPFIAQRAARFGKAASTVRDAVPSLIPGRPVSQPASAGQPATSRPGTANTGTTAKGSTAKISSTAKTSTAKTATGKTGTSKSSAAKASTGKASTGKASTGKNARKAGPAKDSTGAQ